MDRSFDRVAERFDETRAYPESVMNPILQALENALADSKSIVDIGVGTGRFALPLQRKGFEVVGVDISKQMMHKAAEKGTRNLVRADVCHLPFPQNAFDHALSIHVLHLISGWECALAEIGRTTAGDLISVAFNKDESEAEEFRRFYADICMGLGHAVRHLGLRERDLPDVLEPDSVEVVTSHEHMMDVGQMIHNYETRTFSDQWDVPQQVHERAIEALRQRYGHRDDILNRERISVIRWNSERLRTFAATTGSGTTV